MKIVIISLFIFCLSSSLALANTSFKKGAGQDYRYPMRYCNTTDINNPCVVNYMSRVKSLGVTWLYLWGLVDRPAWLDSSIEFVPMIFTKGDGPNSSYTQNALNSYSDWARRYPGSHWLIWNEPDWNSAISPLEAARIYKPLYEAIKQGDPTSKIIVGGLAYIDYGPDSWINKFRNEYNRLYGQYPPLDGWAFHYYQPYTSNNFRNTMNAIHNWLISNNYDGKEFWLTEFGDLSSNEIGLQILKDQQEWLESESWITRYAFFHTGVEEQMKGNLLTGSLNNLGAAQLSPLGLEYAKHPLNAPTPSPSPSQIPTPSPSPTPRPTQTPIPNPTATPLSTPISTSSVCGSVVGSACCPTHTCQSSSGLYCFNETCNKVADKNSTVDEWSAAFNVYNQSLDFNDDNVIDGVDYVFWIREGKSL